MRLGPLLLPSPRPATRRCGGAAAPSRCHPHRLRQPSGDQRCGRVRVEHRHAKRGKDLRDAGHLRQPGVRPALDGEPAPRQGLADRRRLRRRAVQHGEVGERQLMLGPVPRVHRAAVERVKRRAAEHPLDLGGDGLGLGPFVRDREHADRAVGDVRPRGHQLAAGHQRARPDQLHSGPHDRRRRPVAARQPHRRRGRDSPRRTAGSSPRRRRGNRRSPGLGRRSRRSRERRARSAGRSSRYCCSSTSWYSSTNTSVHRARYAAASAASSPSNSAGSVDQVVHVDQAALAQRRVVSRGERGVLVGHGRVSAAGSAVSRTRSDGPVSRIRDTGSRARRDCRPRTAT